MRMKLKLSKEAALERAADLCSRSEYCEREIRDKLHRWGVDIMEIDDVIDYLVDNRFISEERYACAYVHDKYMYSGWGKKKIKMYLSHNRISAAVIKKAMATIDEEKYRDMLRRLVIVKSKSVDLSDYEQKMAAVKYFYGRGYETDLVFETIENFLNANEDNQ